MDPGMFGHISFDLAFLPVIDALPDGEGLILRGNIHTPKEHKRIEEAGRRLAGDLRQRFEPYCRK